MGAKQVIALASSREKLGLVKSLGAGTVIDYSDKTWPEQVREATDGQGVDVVLEAASGEVRNESFKLVARFGRVVFFGEEHSRHNFFRENPTTDLQEPIANWFQCSQPSA
jgi:NADPH:quinone reductase